MIEKTDEELIAQFRNGDETSFEVLYERYKKLINSLARSFFLVGAGIEDLVQEGMFGLFTAMNSFDSSKSSFMTYAFMCIKRRMINAVNKATADKHKALNNSVSISDYDTENEGPICFSPEYVIIGSENLKELTNKIRSTLSPFEIKVFDRYVEGENYKEIAEVLKKSPKSVDNAIQRIKEKSKKFRSV